jgi:hypothetical protein
MTAGLKIFFCLSYSRSALRQVTLIKLYQNYYSKLRRNIGIIVFTGRILTTLINAAEMEHTCDSDKEGHVLISYIY